MRRTRRLACVAALLVASSCGPGVEDSVRACTEILARRIPPAHVTTGSADSQLDAALDYEVRGDWWRWDDAVQGHIACAFEAGPRGGLRLRAATLDGVDFTRAEVTVINADRLLADMQRAGAAAADE
jgi:hypothetical protein